MGGVGGWTVEVLTDGCERVRVERLVRVIDAGILILAVAERRYKLLAAGGCWVIRFVVS